MLNIPHVQVDGEYIPVSIPENAYFLQHVRKHCLADSVAVPLDEKKPERFPQMHKRVRGIIDALLVELGERENYDCLDYPESSYNCKEESETCSFLYGNSPNCSEALTGSGEDESLACEYKGEIERTLKNRYKHRWGVRKEASRGRSMLIVGQDGLFVVLSEAHDRRSMLFVSAYYVVPTRYRVEIARLRNKLGALSRRLLDLAVQKIDQESRGSSHG